MAELQSFNIHVEDVHRSLRLHHFDKFGYLRGESGSLFTPVFMLWSISLIGGHVWRRVIVPFDLAQSFSVICVHHCYHVIHRWINIMRTLLSPHRKGNLHLLGGLSYKKKNQEVQ